MDIKSLIAAYLISQGAHTAGHFYQANNPDMPMKDVPISLDIKNLKENWDVPNNWQPVKKDAPYANLRQSYKDFKEDRNRQSADIRGAGFAMQDKIRDAVDNPKLKSNVSLMNALIKGAYLSGVPMKLSGQLKGGGDLAGMEKTSGNKNVKSLVALSGLMDLYKMSNPVSTSSLQFKVVDGAPGLVFNKRF